MAIQFGFMTIFACAMPLASCFALFMNWTEIWVDARNMVWHCRRPVFRSAEDIGAWTPVFAFLTSVSVHLCRHGRVCRLLGESLGPLPSQARTRRGFHPIVIPTNEP